MAGREDWYRNQQWSPEIESLFDGKLKRSRTQEPQHLCIQAMTLAKIEPRVALRLLDRYFATGDDFDMNRALQAKAEALEAQNMLDEAVAAYVETLAWEQTHPYSLTTAHLALPFLIASRRLTKHYDLASQTLASGYDPVPPVSARPKYTLAFPASIFMHAYALCVIRCERGDQAGATEQAQVALTAAYATESQLSRHRNLGLVADRFRQEVEELENFVASPATSLKQRLKCPVLPE